MKFIISSHLLSARLQSISRVISTKNTLPILDSILFSIEGSMLTLTASDNETTLSTRLELVESDENIVFAVNARTVQDAIKEIPEQPLCFYVNTATFEVTVEYQNGKYQFMAQPGDEYPTPPELDADAAQLSLGAPALLSSVTRTIFASADDPLRPVFSGIYFDIHENMVAIVAADSQKLACSRMLGLDGLRAGSFILPKKPASFLKNFLAKETGDVLIRYSNRNAVISTESYTMNCRLIEGKYPEYERVIPDNNPNCVTVNRAAMLSTLRRVLIFSSSQSTPVKLQLANSCMTVSSQDIDFSMSAEETLLCDYSAMPLTIGFNGAYLLEMLNNMEGEEVVMKIADPGRACIIVPAQNPEHTEILMLLIPIQVGY